MANNGNKGWKNDEDIGELWHNLFQETKQFLTDKPWQKINDNKLIVIKIDEIDDYFFCSILGQSKELYGLAIQIGIDGIVSIIDSFEQVKSPHEIGLHQRSILLSFEDRTELRKIEYERVKQSGVSFRGKKFWPTFTSYKPGFLPWELNREELIHTKAVLSTLNNTFEHITTAVELPNFADNEDVTLIVQQADQFHIEKASIEDMMLSLLNVKEYTTIFPSEIEVRRLKRAMKERLDICVEFRGTYLDIPVDAPEANQPIFPAVSLAVNCDNASMYYYKMQNTPHTSETLQYNFLQFLHELGGMPDQILVDDYTYYRILPLAEILEIEIDFEQLFPAMEFVLHKVKSTLLDELENST